MEDDDRSAVGKHLLEHARESWMQPRGMLQDLFPFIYEASKRLSSRAISRWLEQEHSLKISNVSVAKALRHPEKYWEEFAERLEPSVREIENETNAPAESFLANERLLDHLGPEASQRLEHQDAFNDGQGSATFDAAVHALKEYWYPLGVATRKEIMPYLLKSFPNLSENPPE